MPKSAPKFSAKSRRTSSISTKKPPRHVRRRLIFALAAAACIALAAVGAQRYWPSTDDQHVLGETEFRPTALDQNFYDQVKGCFFPVASAYGYQLDIVSGFRSIADQDAIYAQGRTTPGDVVTNAQGGESLHNYGLAVDVVDDRRSYDINWERLGQIGGYCGLEQGDRGHEDLPHFQHRGGLSLDQIAAGRAPNKLQFPCQLMTDRYNQHRPLSKNDLDACKAPKFR